MIHILWSLCIHFIQVRNMGYMYMYLITNIICMYLSIKTILTYNILDADLFTSKWTPYPNFVNFLINWKIKKSNTLNRRREIMLLLWISFVMSSKINRLVYSNCAHSHPISFWLFTFLSLHNVVFLHM